MSDSSPANSAALDTPSAPTPDPSVSATAPSRCALPTGDELSKYNTVLAHLVRSDFAPPLQLQHFRAWQKWTKNPTKSAIPCETQSLNDTEKCFLSQEQILRFLRAVKWDTDKAISRAEETITWRRDFGVDTMAADDIEPEALTGKEMILGYDFESRPCLYMYPYRQNTEVSPRQIKFAVWVLERTIDLMPPGVEKLSLMIDFGAGKSGGGGKPTTLGQARQVLNILQTYYCERLGRAICVNVPFVFWGFYKLVNPFIDPVTRDKVRFNPQVRDLVPPEQLEKANFGGDLDFEYKHDEYFHLLVKLTQDRKAAHLERFRRSGAAVGTSEWIIRGAEEKNATTKEVNESEKQESSEPSAKPESKESSGSESYTTAVPKDENEVLTGTENSNSNITQTNNDNGLSPASADSTTPASSLLNPSGDNTATNTPTTPIAPDLSKESETLSKLVNGLETTNINQQEPTST